ncbi:MAG: methyl-accepting chemotaxis protein [Oscillospiraceae bacterium]|nr:methyl-accepting chemotaxis protein [Oscillospiraceae bacterium]
MNEMAKKNKMVITALLSAQLLILGGYIIQVFFPYGENPIVPRDILEVFLLPLICDAAALYFYFKNKESIGVRNACFASLMVFLAVAFYLQHNPLLYIIGFPIVITFGYYNNYKFTLVSCLSLLGLNVAAAVYDIITIPGHLDDNSVVMFQVVTHVFLLFTLPNSVKFIQHEHDANIKQEQQRADEIAEILDQSHKTTDLIKDVIRDTSGKVQELTETMVTFKERVASDALDAENSAVLAGRSRSDVIKSNEQVEKAIEAINNISAISNEIGNINNVINNISSQTNILALNASVEAVRAGNAGQSFAVVADQIRALSQRSALAASETDELVKRTFAAVKLGNEEIKTVADILNTVRKNSEQMEQLSKNISDSVHLQQNMVDSVRLITEHIEQYINNLSGN